MSIQEVKAKNKPFKIFTIIGIIWQVIYRMVTSGRPRVFFRYFTANTHPIFSRFYQFPPIAWSNIYYYDIAHWINYPAYINKKPFILEVNDHPLAAISFKKRGIFEPGDLLKSISDVEEVYASKYCTKILIASDGYKNIFHHYFDEKYDEKFIEVHSPGCIPQKNLSLKNESEPIVFCCLASDYFIKGVDLVIDGWLSLKRKGDARLIIACPNIPSNVMKYLTLESGIQIVPRAPLSSKEKNQILSAASITIAPTHISGGSTIAEGMEYGHIIVHFEFHNTEFDSIGTKIKVPYNFYTPVEYGNRWKTFEEFKQILFKDKFDGVFNSVREEITNVLQGLIDDRKRINERRIFTYNKANEEFSLKMRNEKLVKIYKESCRLKI